MADEPPGFAARGNTGYFFVGVVLMLAKEMASEPATSTVGAECCGEFGIALRAVEAALGMFRRAGGNQKVLRAAADELDRATHRIRCYVNSISGKEMI
ncbi:MAG TPA: hypothetical protein PK728_04695 [Bacillota bacterium]|nr:hypothetical protein [Bacillota bacterium]